MAWNCDTCVYRKTVELNDLALDCCSNQSADRYFGMMRACPEYKHKIVEKEKLISLDKACEWIEDNIFDFPWYDSEGEFTSKDVADAFRKAMEE